MKSGEKLDPATSLTPREGEVFQLLLQGMKAREIACELSISPSGVNYFVKRIYKKLQVRSRVELVIRYYDLRQPRG